MKKNASIEQICAQLGEDAGKFIITKEF